MYHGKEIVYNLEKQKFNSLYGFSVTNNIRDTVIFENSLGWIEQPLTNEEIQKALQKEKYKGFLAFSYGVFITAYARYNLISNLIKQDDYCCYADTDSLKLENGFDIEKINEYNKSVEEKLKKVSTDLEIPFESFAPKDKNGNPHMLGLFEEDGKYEEFITQGAKKYAYTKWIKKEKVKDPKKLNIIKETIDKYLVLEITVSGVPKKGAKGLKRLEDFKDDFIFEYKDTGKNLLIYNDEMIEFELEDYKGNKQNIKTKYGCVLVPTTYELGKAEEYAELLSDHSSKRSIYMED